MTLVYGGLGGVQRSPVTLADGANMVQARAEKGWDKLSKTRW